MIALAKLTPIFGLVILASAASADPGTLSLSFTAGGFTNDVPSEQTPPVDEVSGSLSLTMDFASHEEEGALDTLDLTFLGVSYQPDQLWFDYFPPADELAILESQHGVNFRLLIFGFNTMFTGGTIQPYFDYFLLSGNGTWTAQDVEITSASFSGSVKATPIVPEPTTWAMMLGGFGLVGGALRSRRNKAAVSFG